ncbi:hypothetical protein MS6016_14100 [Klebsiella variicola]|nr:hypothetical protein NUKP40_26630 [Klebsiella variicola]GKO55592.1 hypothetical protein MS6016_14100 [Klebsiella variicola]
MGGDVHHNDRLFTLFRLRRGRLLRLYRLRLDHGGLRRGNRLLRGGWLRLGNGRRHRLRCDGLLHNGLRLMLGLHGRLRGLRLLPARLRSRMLLSLRLNRGLARRLLRLANRFIRTHRLLHLALVRRLVLVLRRLTRGFMLPMRAVRGVSDRMNADFTYAFNIIIKVFVFRLIVARLHTFQWAIAKHRRTFFTAGPKTMYQ